MDLLVLCMLGSSTMKLKQTGFGRMGQKLITRTGRQVSGNHASFVFYICSEAFTLNLGFGNESSYKATMHFFLYHSTVYPLIHLLIHWFPTYSVIPLLSSYPWIFRIL